MRGKSGTLKGIIAHDGRKILGQSIDSKGWMNGEGSPSLKCLHYTEKQLCKHQ